MSPRARDYWVDVCDACLKASCWHGTWPCGRANQAGLARRTASELDALGREDVTYYSPETLRRVTGNPPEAA